jgi:hypothetical protein
VVGDFVDIGGRIRPPGGKTDMAFLLPMKFPLGGGSFRASFILVANDADCEANVGFATGFDFAEAMFGTPAPASAVSDGEDSNAEPLSMTPKPPSNSAGFRDVASASLLGADPPVALVCLSDDRRWTGFADSCSSAVLDGVVPSNCVLLRSAIVPTSLAFLRPHC